jgi:hypothetical protein
VPPEAIRLDRSLYESPAPIEPGSYTMIIGKGAQSVPGGVGTEPFFVPPPPPAPAAPAPQSPPPPKARSKTPLVVMLVLIVSILVAMMLFIALRPQA